MKNKFNLKKLASVLAVLFLALTVVSCQRDEEEDDLPQEELTNIILNVKDLSTSVVTTYNYSVGSGAAPAIKLADGKSYEVEMVFKNGNEDVTQEIKDAKDEHFLTFDFPKSSVTLTRIDDASSTRTDGKKVGLKTKWDVTKVVNSSSPVVKVSLYHESATVSESLNGTVWGSQTGGETDAEATFGLSN